MTLINKIGLLGLIGVVALIIIYVIRPNYQQKTISSTYIWKLSLKKKKKKVPVSTIRNLLLFLCQMLALTCLAMILVKPAIVLKTPEEETETILILDTSASMRTENDETGGTRFERAVSAVKEQFTHTLQNNGTVSVIIAGAKPEYLCKRISGDGATIMLLLNELTEEDCGFEAADIDAALKESEDILYENPDAAIYVYTDADYEYIAPDAGITVVNVSEEGEWNAAILDARAVWDEGYYSFTVQVACYGKAARIPLTLEAFDVNSVEGYRQKFETTVSCDDGVTTNVVFKYKKDGEAADDSVNLGNAGYNDKIYAFKSVHLTLDVTDNYDFDDTFDIYGGQKQVLKVQYSSAEPNPFVNGVLSNLSGDYADLWDIQVTEVKKGEVGATEGFDLYVFEHQMPTKMPEDGVTFLLNPQSAPSGCGFRRDGALPLASTRGEYPTLYGETDHPVVKNLNPNYIRVSYCQALSDLAAGYQVLFSLNQLPMLMVRNDMENEGGAQTLVMSFGVNYSNIGVLPEFYLLWKNAFEYFFPSTVDKFVYDINEKAELNARGSSLTIEANAFEEPVIKDAFPATVSFPAPGTYTISQTTYYGTSIREFIFVRMPAEESNITGVRGSLYKPNREKNEADYFKDVITYIAAALVAFLFIEWCLHLKDGV